MALRLVSLILVTRNRCCGETCCWFCVIYSVLTLPYAFFISVKFLYLSELVSLQLEGVFFVRKLRSIITFN